MGTCAAGPVGMALPERPAERLEAAYAAEQAEIELNKRRQANADGPANLQAAARPDVLEAARAVE